MATSRRGRQVAKVEETPVTVYSEDRPSFLPDPTVAGRGQENVKVEDLSIPRLGIIQSLSPQRKRNDPAYIEGAEEGTMFNSITNKLYGDKVLFVPTFFRKEFIIWKARDAGGGFNGAYSSKEEALEVMRDNGWDDEMYKDEHGNKLPSYEIVDTAQQFGMIVNPESTLEEPDVDDIVISMSKSQMSVSRRLNTMISMTGGDRFARIYEIEVAEVNGKKGDYYNFTVKPLGWVNEALYKHGEKMYESISSGDRDVNRDYDAPKDKSGNEEREY